MSYFDLLLLKVSKIKVRKENFSELIAKTTAVYVGNNDTSHSSP